MAADWKFASHEGYLSWTLPALPSGGQRLYSRLTPTLLLGQLQVDDAVPVDYLDVPSIREVFLKSAISIQCDRHSGESVLLVADTADQAREWLSSIRQAMRNSEHYTASAVQTSPITTNVPRMSWEASTSQTPYSTLSSALREEKLRQEGNGHQQQQQPPQQQQGYSSSAQTAPTGLQQQHQPEQQQQQQQFSSSQPNRNTQQFDQQSQQQQQQAYSSNVAPTLDQRPPLHTQDNSWRGTPATPYQQPQQQQQQQTFDARPLPYGISDGFQRDASNGNGHSSNGPSRPMPPTNFDSTDDAARGVRPVSMASGLETPRTYGMASTSGLSLADSGMSRPLPPDGTAAMRQQQPHPTDLRYGGGQQQYGAGGASNGVAQATSVATQEERPVAGLGRPLSLQIPSGSTTSSNGVALGSVRFGGLHTTDNNGAAPLPPPSSDWGLGSGGSRPLSPEHMSRPLDPNGQLRYTSAAAGAGGGANSNATSSMGAFGRVPDVSPYPARSMREGPLPRARGGMMIDLPGTQAVNRSIAPNMSAAWKEWVAPDGATYYFHEPTHTLQRLRPGETEYETMVEGVEDVPEADLQQRSHDPSAPTVNLNTHTLRNLQSYGTVTTGTGVNSVRSADLYRTEVLPAAPRGAYSPSRQGAVEALAAPRVANQAYQGKRLHRLTLQPGDEPGQAVVTHQVQSLDAGALSFDRATGAVFNRDSERQGNVGAATLFRQWEHVRKVLNQGRYFKKHALRSDTEAFRFVFLTGDNSYVCCVPTSQVMLNVHKDPMTFGNATDTIQYYGPDTRAMAVNSITHVVLGTEEPMVYRRSKLDPEATFVIVGRTHALILECNTPDEAKFYCDAWNFFLYYSKPTNTKAMRTPQMAAPVTLGTRTGVAF